MLDEYIGGGGITLPKICRRNGAGKGGNVRRAGRLRLGGYLDSPGRGLLLLPRY